MEQPTAPRGRRHGCEERPDPAAAPPFDFVGLLRRARRNAELSQREMAAAIGVSKATIARAERDGGSV
jgi:HTH-type transcriptional regulator/antitoxin HipB